MDRREPLTILMADDDHADCLLVKKALEKIRLPNRLFIVHDGEELMDYLHRRGKYEDVTEYPDPGVILLDLNMPRKSGHEALQEIKNSPQLRHHPIIVLTTSNNEVDILESYDLGSNSFITKPVSFDRLVEVMQGIGNYWIKIVRLP